MWALSTCFFALYIAVTAGRMLVCALVGGNPETSSGLERLKGEKGRAGRTHGSDCSRLLLGKGEYEEDHHSAAASHHIKRKLHIE